MNTSHLARLTDIYCEFAAHLLSIPEVREFGSDTEQWLADRALTGLPDGLGWRRRPRHIVCGGVDSNDDREMVRILYHFMYANTTANPPSIFKYYMQRAARGLVDGGWPPFPRESELISPDE